MESQTIALLLYLNIYLVSLTWFDHCSPYYRHLKLSRSFELSCGFLLRRKAAYTWHPTPLEDL